MTEASGLRFDRPIVRGGYAWTYLDVVSDDGAHALVVIALVGNVFSPFYRRERLRGHGDVDPTRFSSMNVALYSQQTRSYARWALTEGSRVRIASNTLAIGQSSLALGAAGNSLTYLIEERSAVSGKPVRGRVHVRTVPDHRVFAERTFSIDAHGRHRWRPHAPRARVEVDLDEPKLRFCGTGYVDANDGDEGLESGFRSWSWARLSEPSTGAVTVLYDVTLPSGEVRVLTYRVDAEGNEEPAVDTSSLELRSFGRTGWGLARHVRVDRGAHIHDVRSLESGPFYARSELRTRLFGHDVHGTHESVDLVRFTSPIVQHLVPYRMRRET